MPAIKQVNEVKMSKDLMVCVSGGRSSAMMARHIQTSPKYKDFNIIYVFCNTGMERPETIDFLKNIEKHWGLDLVKIEGVYSGIMGEGVKYKIVDWEGLDMRARPFSGAILHKNKGDFNGLPNSASPYCSDMLKVRPSHKLAMSVFGNNKFSKAIGFRKEDMPKRICWAEIESDEKRIFPLLTDFDQPISQLDLNRWWSNQKFKLEIHGALGNCELCWKKSTRNLIKSIQYGTRFIEWFQRHEYKYGNTSFRSKMSINDLVKKSKLGYTPEFDWDGNNEGCVCNF